MRWYYTKNGEVNGPVEPDMITQWAKAGRLGPEWMVRDESSSDWTPIMHSPFAAALSAARKDPGFSLARIAVGVLVGVVVAPLLLIAVVAIAARYGRADESISPEEEHTPAPPAYAPPPPREKTAVERLAQETSLLGALGVATPLFADSTNEIDQGSALFAVWAARNLRWSELQTVKETQRALVMKDPEAERGKRLCASGSIVEIRADRSTGTPIYNGALMTPSFNAIRFAAVGETGDLVEQSAARFCGIVTGVMMYSNAGGGTTHAVYAVGMFDLPANKAARAATL